MLRCLLVLALLIVSAGCEKTIHEANTAQQRQALAVAR